MILHKYLLMKYNIFYNFRYFLVNTQDKIEFERIINNKKKPRGLSRGVYGLSLFVMPVDIFIQVLIQGTDDFPPQFHGRGEVPGIYGPDIRGEPELLDLFPFGKAFIGFVHFPLILPRSDDTRFPVKSEFPLRPDPTPREIRFLISSVD